MSRYEVCAIRGHGPWGGIDNNTCLECGKHREESEIHHLEREFNKLRARVERIERTLLVPTTITLNLENTMPQIGFVATATATETDAAGVNVPVVPANLAFASDNEAVATIVSNGDGTATVTAVAVGSANLTVTDSAFSLTSLPVSVTVTAAPDNPTTLVLSLGTFAAPAVS